MPFESRRFPTDVPELSTDGVGLRAHRPEDAVAIVEQCTDPRSVRWTTVPLGYDEPMARSWVEQSIATAWADGSARVFAVEATHRDGRRRFAGTVDLRWIDDRRAELAFGSHPGVRGTGVMTTAVRLLVDHAFDTLGLESLVWWTEVGNWGSRRLAWDLGFDITPGAVPRWLDTRDGLADAWVGTLHRDAARSPVRSVPVLRTTRLELRPHRAADDQRVVAACSDVETQYWLSQLPSPYTPADAATYRHSTATGMLPDQLHWAVAERGSGVLVADLSLMRRGPATHEIGYWTHPDARRRGFITEAVTRVAEQALAPSETGGLGSHRLVIRAAEGNLGSQRAALAAGFQPCGRETGTVALRDGSRLDHLVFERVAH